MKKLSFVLPCFNVGRYISDCLDSLYNQGLSEEEFEVLCINDCSTDDTRDVILSFNKGHSNLKLIDHTENLTAGGARNTGIEIAQGEYIWFVDPDDAIKENCFSELYDKAKDTDADVLFFNFDDADENLKVLVEDRTYPDSIVCTGQEFIAKYFPNRFSVFGIIWRELYKASFLKSSGIRYPIMRKAQDVVFLWKVMLTAEKVCSVSKAYYTYRNNPYSVTKHQTFAKVAFSDRILRACEIIKMMRGKTILPVIRDDMMRNVRWCACSNTELLMQMSAEEIRRYYQEIAQHQGAVAIVRPFMNRKNRILFDTSLGNRYWLLKARMICWFERGKHK